MSAPREQVLKWLQKAVHAPSGDNAQPWRFRLQEDALEIHNATGSDPTLYNLRERGSYLALGAVAENVRILAEGDGYEVRIDAFPPDGKCAARLMFAKATPHAQPLAQCIERRSTNRRPYEPTPLATEARAALIAAAREVGGTLVLSESNEAVSAIAEAVSLNERLLMEHRGLHGALFKMIRYTKASEVRTPGLYIKTMELPLPVEIMFRTILRSWRGVRMLNALGFSRSLPKQTAPIYRSSAAFGAIILQGNRDQDFFAAGRAFQRVWLTATLHDVWLQPTAAIAYLRQRIRGGDSSMFDEEHRALVVDAYARIAHAFGIDDSTDIGMLFRVGHASTPSATSYKAPPILLA